MTNTVLSHQCKYNVVTNERTGLKPFFNIQPLRTSGVRYIRIHIVCNSVMIVDQTLFIQKEKEGKEDRINMCLYILILSFFHFFSLCIIASNLLSYNIYKIFVLTDSSSPSPNHRNYKDEILGVVSCYHVDID